ncbi:MAG: ATP synthase F1 subunit delta [Cyanobacteria bacterium P01_H01_bin.74]
MSKTIEMSKIASRYARALFEKAQLQSDDTLILEELQCILTVFNNLPELMQFLMSPAVSYDKKQVLISTNFKDANPLVYSLLQLLLNNKRFATLPLLVREYETQYHLHHKIAKAELQSPLLLDDDLQVQVVEALKKTFGYHAIQISQTINPDLLGGMLIRLSDTVIDYSYRGRLKTLKKLILQRT